MTSYVKVKMNSNKVWIYLCMLHLLEPICTSNHLYQRQPVIFCAPHLENVLN